MYIVSPKRIWSFFSYNLQKQIELILSETHHKISHDFKTNNFYFPFFSYIRKHLFEIYNSLVSIFTFLKFKKSFAKLNQYAYLIPITLSEYLYLSIFHSVMIKSYNPWTIPSIWILQVKILEWVAIPFSKK